MPSNSVLIERIEKLTKKLNVSEIKTEGLTNTELAETLVNLRAIKESQESGEDEAGEVPATPPTLSNPVITTAPTSTLNGGYVVAPGKALTCKRGVIAGGELALPEFFGGGQARIDSLLERGYLVKA